jgi:transitional endoplasmic reticulum ATPase
MLDGLESESAGRICVMMTAMDVANLPPALVRSGRVELWLEMKMPDAAARHQILERHVADMPEQLRAVAMPGLIEATDTFTGADLKRLVEDAKAIYAYDTAKGIAPTPATDYFLRAAEGVRENKQRYAQAETQAHLNSRLPGRGFPGFLMRSFSMPAGDQED